MRPLLTFIVAYHVEPRLLHGEHSDSTLAIVLSVVTAVVDALGGHPLRWRWDRWRPWFERRARLSGARGAGAAFSVPTILTQRPRRASVLRRLSLGPACRVGLRGTRTELQLVYRRGLTDEHDWRRLARWAGIDSCVGSEAISSGS